MATLGRRGYVLGGSDRAPLESCESFGPETLPLHAVPDVPALQAHLAHLASQGGEANDGRAGPDEARAGQAKWDWREEPDLPYAAR